MTASQARSGKMARWPISTRAEAAGVEAGAAD